MHQMARFIALFTLLALSAACLAGCAVGMNMAPASQVQPSGVYARPGIAQSQYECVTDDGYGRWAPCGNQH
jgi:hypothetical protein